jgi:integrase
VRPKVVPLSIEAVDGLADAVPAQYRALVILCAGMGLRQGEAFGLTEDRVDFLRRSLEVDRQLIGQDAGRPEVRATEDGGERAHSAANPLCGQSADRSSSPGTCRRRSQA